MRRFVIILLLLISCHFGVQAREVIDFNRGWEFFFSTEGTSDNARSVNLPHTWNRDALGTSGSYIRGIGNYIKDIEVPLRWRNKRVFLRFNSASTVADVMVDSKYAGGHKGGYSAFTVEVTSLLNYGGVSRIMVMVNNSPRMDLLPTAGDMNIYGGICRDVDLIVVEPSMVSLTDYSGDGVYFNQRLVTQQKADIDAIIKLDGISDRTLNVILEVQNHSSQVVYTASQKVKVADSGKNQITIPIDIQNPRLWNGTQDPYMYNVTVRVFDEDNLCDSLCLPLGIRTFTVDPREGFTLNGSHYPLRGVVYYEDRAVVGNALMPYHVTEDLDLMVEMGINAIRAGGYAHNPDFYTECDKRGIIVWSDLPFTGEAFAADVEFLNNDDFKNNARQQLMEMIYQHYNNPSVLMWGLFSNLSIKGDSPSAFIRELNTKALELDPSRLTVASSNVDGDINFITDLICWDHVLGWKQGNTSDITVWLQQLATNWGSLCSAISYGAGGSILHQEDILVKPNYLSAWHPERWQTHFHEQYFAQLKDAKFLWGTFVANMFDYGASSRNWGDGTGVDDRGVVTFDRKYRKDAFYFYKANWNKNTPFVHIAEKRWIRRKSNIQTLKVYSNAHQVELLLNGESLGVADSIANGTFLWHEVELPVGRSCRLEARVLGDQGAAHSEAGAGIGLGDNLTDYATIEATSKAPLPTSAK